MRDEDLRIVRVMENYMGSFCNALATACYRADATNIERIKAAFEEYWLQAKDIADKLDQEKIRSRQYDSPMRGVLCTDCWVQRTVRRWADVMIDGHPVCIEHAGGDEEMVFECASRRGRDHSNGCACPQPMGT